MVRSLVSVVSLFADSHTTNYSVGNYNDPRCQLNSILSIFIAGYYQVETESQRNRITVSQQWHFKSTSEIDFNAWLSGLDFNPAVFAPGRQSQQGLLELEMAEEGRHV